MHWNGIHSSITIDDTFDMALLENVAVKEAAFQAATVIAQKVRADAPVRTGRYRDSIMVQAFRGGARVVSDDPIAHILEFGAPNRGLPGRYILRNAAAALGFHFRGA